MPHAAAFVFVVKEKPWSNHQRQHLHEDMEDDNTLKLAGKL